MDSGEFDSRCAGAQPKASKILLLQADRRETSKIRLCVEGEWRYRNKMEDFQEVRRSSKETETTHQNAD
jgi:hypothetical protein